MRQINADDFSEGAVPARGELVEKRLTGDIIGAFYEVYNELRYGFLEAVYRDALAIELGLRGVAIEREVPLQVRFKGRPVGRYRADLLVRGVVLVEIKAGKAPDPNGGAQLLNYLRATDLRVGLLLYFGPEPRFQRIVHTARPLGHRGRRDDPR